MQDALKTSRVLELQGIPVERIALEEPKAYQEHAVFFHRARGLDDITGRDASIVPCRNGRRLSGWNWPLC